MVFNTTVYLNNITSNHPFIGVFGMYNDVFGGYFLFLLYFTFRILLLIKNRNALIGWVVTILFLGLYTSMYYSTQYFSHTGLAIIFIVVVFELAATLYNVFVK